MCRNARMLHEKFIPKPISVTVASMEDMKSVIRKVVFQRVSPPPFRPLHVTFIQRRIQEFREERRALCTNYYVTARRRIVREMFNCFLYCCALYRNLFGRFGRWKIPPDSYLLRMLRAHYGTRTVNLILFAVYFSYPMLEKYSILGK